MAAGAGSVLAVVALALGGTLAPFTLFAFGQSRVSAEVAGAFLNLEPLVGAITGAVAFGDKVGLVQVAGGLAILAGIALSSLPLITARRAEARRVAAAPVATAVPAMAAAPAGASHGTAASGTAVPPGNHGNAPSTWSRPRQCSIDMVSDPGPARERGDQGPRQHHGPLRSWHRGRAAGRPPDRGRRPGSGAGRTGERRGRAARGLPARGRLTSGGGPGGSGRRATGGRGRSWPGASTGRAAAGRWPRRAGTARRR
jgi:EamA-like transporter family